MKPILTLTNPTDDELSDAVAVYAAHWKYERWGDRPHEISWITPEQTYGDRPPYATSADAVLTLLEKYDAWSKGTTGGAVTVYKLVLSPAKKPSEDIPDAEWMMLKPVGHYWNCQNPKPFPYSACIALLRANNIEVIFT